MEIRKEFELYALPQLEGLYRTALYISENESNAQELVQESFVRAYRFWQEIKSAPKDRVWLFKIMVNTLINKYRLFPGPPTAKDIVDMTDESWEFSHWENQYPNVDSVQDAFSAISEDHVKKAIGNLPHEIRLIVVLSLLEEFSYQEIADIAGINLETVKSRLQKGRGLMQRELFDRVVCKGKDIILAGRVRSKESS